MVSSLIVLTGTSQTSSFPGNNGPKTNCGYERLVSSWNYGAVRSKWRWWQGFILLGSNLWMNESTDNQMLQANSPVVPAGVISLRCLTTSIRFESLAVSAKQRIIRVVSGVGFSKSVSSNCRFSLSWSTISFGSDDGDASDSTTLPGRVTDLSSLSKGIEHSRNIRYHCNRKLYSEKKNPVNSVFY